MGVEGCQVEQHRGGGGGYEEHGEVGEEATRSMESDWQGCG